MPFKIKAGKGEILCDSCQHSHVVRGHGRELVQCTQGYGDVPLILDFRVTECNRYRKENPNEMSLHQMEKVAMVLVHKGDKVGFVSSKKFKELNPDEEHDITPDVNLPGV